MAESSDTIRLNQIIDSGVNIYGSREKIRSELVKYAKKYFNISDDSDISKASYLAYLIDMLSILTSNQVYYQSRLYNEFFIVSANMNESVQNLAKWIGYKIPKAQCAEVNVLFTVPLKFSSSVVNFNLSKYFKVYGGSIPFTIKSNNNSTDSESAASTIIIDQDKIDKSSLGRIINNSAVTVSDYNGFYRPVYIAEDKSYCGFSLIFEQCEYEVQSFYIPSDLGQNQFFQKELAFDGQVADMTVYLCEPTIGQTLTINSNDDSFSSVEKFDASNVIIDSSGNACKFTKWEECVNGIYTISSTSKQYDWVGYYNKGIMSFGNGVLGKQPNPGSLVVCVLKITKGADGNIVNNVISTGDEIIWNSMSMSYSVINPNAAYGGVDILSTSELKQNAIVNLKSRKRLVTDDDYNNITDVVTKTTMSDCIPLLKRSDIKINDVTLYFILNFYNSSVNTIVPTRNITYDLVDPEWNETTNELLIPKNSEYYSGPDRLKFLTVFNCVCNRNTRMAKFYYTATKITGVTTELYNNSVSNSLSRNAFIEAIDTNFETDYTVIKSIDNKYPIKIQLNLNHIANKILDGHGTDTCHKFIDVDYEWSIDDMLPKYANDGSLVQSNYFEMVNFKGIMITKWGINDTYDDTSDGYYEQTTIDKSSDKGLDYVTKQYNSITFVIPDYTSIPNGKQRFEFYILCHAPKRDKNGNILCIHNGQQVVGIDYSKNINGTKASEDLDGTDPIVMEWQVLKKYYCDVIINQDLSSCMQSSITVDNYLCGKRQGNNPDGTEIKVYHVHEVPSIYEPYYREVMSGNGDFELNVLQRLLENVNFNSYRMMTDFTNIKFADTYGSLTNLRYNRCDYEVESRYIHTPWWDKQQDYTTLKPDGVNFLPEDQYEEIKAKDDDSIAYYVINGKIDNYDDSVPVTDYIGYIAVRIATISKSGDITYSYTQIKPTLGMIIKVKDELDTEGYMQTCIWNGRNWIDVEKYTIPLSIKLKVEVDEDKVAKSDDSLKAEIIKVLSEYYNDSSKMGLQKQLDRSEINRVCRSINGVEYVEVLDPEFDIKFDYDLVSNLVDGSGKLTQKELLNFTPQYVGFRTVTDTNTDYKNTTIDIEIIRK